MRHRHQQFIYLRLTAEGRETRDPPAPIHGIMAHFTFTLQVSDAVRAVAPGRRRADARGQSADRQEHPAADGRA